MTQKLNEQDQSFLIPHHHIALTVSGLIQFTSNFIVCNLLRTHSRKSIVLNYKWAGNNCTLKLINTANKTWQRDQYAINYVYFLYYIIFIETYSPILFCYPSHKHFYNTLKIHGFCHKKSFSKTILRSLKIVQTNNVSSQYYQISTFSSILEK